MPTHIQLTPSDHSAHPNAKLHFERLLAIGASFAFWAVVLVGLKLLAI